MAKAPTPGTTRAPESVALAVTISGQRWVFALDAITALDELKLRTSAGMTLQELISAFQTAPGRDLVGIVVWLARRQAGHDVELDEVLRGITASTEFDLDGGDPPEA